MLMFSLRYSMADVCLSNSKRVWIKASAARNMIETSILVSLLRSCRTVLHTETLLTGLSMRELIHQFKWQTLVLFKCLLLQPKVRHEHPSKGQC
jgi:hypothetical protein